MSPEKKCWNYLLGSGVWDVIGDRYDSPKSKSLKGTCFFFSSEIELPVQSAEMSSQSKAWK